MKGRTSTYLTPDPVYYLGEFEFDLKLPLQPQIPATLPTIKMSSNT